MEGGENFHEKFVKNLARFFGNILVAKGHVMVLGFMNNLNDCILLANTIQHFTVAKSFEKDERISLSQDLSKMDSPEDRKVMLIDVLKNHGLEDTKEKPYLAILREVKTRKK